jgi:hypothetical protein
MRKLFPLVFICLCGTVATAQNVGIGTPNPLNKLHVAGGLRLDTLTGVGAAGLLWHNPSGVVYGLKFSGNANDVLRGDGSFGSFSGSGINYWSANGTHIYNNNTGNVGIGTTTPGAGLELRGIDLKAQQRITDNTSGNTLVLQGGNGDDLKVTGYNYSTGTAQPLYLSVDGANTIINPYGGYVGIGTKTPGAGLELSGFDLGSQQRITDRASGNSLVFQAGTGFNTKISAYNYATNTARTLYVSPDGGNTIINPTAGGVGIGRLAISPGYLLDVGGPVKSVDALSTHFVAQTTGGTNSWARYYMRSNAQSWFMGTSQDFNGNQLYIADETYNQTRLSIQPNGGPINVQGNFTQNLGGYGLPKAMVYINGDGTIIRCYNALTNSSSGGCGFAVTKTSQGNYSVNLGFDLSTRFISVSLQNAGTGRPVTISYEPGPANVVDVLVYLSDEGDGATFENTVGTDRPFMLFVF